MSSVEEPGINDWGSLMSQTFDDSGQIVLIHVLSLNLRGQVYTLSIYMSQRGIIGEAIYSSCRGPLPPPLHEHQLFYEES